MQGTVVRRTSWWIALVVVATVLACLSTPGLGLPPLALPAGVLVAATLRLPRRAALAVTAATVVGLAVSYGLTGRSSWQALLLAVIVAAGAVLVAGVLRWREDGRVGALSDLVVMGSFALLGSLVTTAALSLAEPGTRPAWPMWWLAVCLGIVLPAPGLLSRSVWTLPRARPQVVEVGLLLSAVAVLTALAYLARAAVVPGRPGYLLLPVLLWLGLRLGLQPVSAASTVVASVLIGGEVRAGWAAATQAAWPAHVLTVVATVTGLLLIYAVAVQEQKRRDGERQLRSNQDFVRSMLTNSGAIVAVTRYDDHGNGALSVISPTFAALLSTPEEDLRGRGWPEVLGPASGAQARNEDLQVLRSGTSQVFVSRVGPRERRRTLMATRFPLPTGDSGQRSVAMVALDVTDHRRRDRIMRLTFDLSPVPMARLAVTGQGLGHVLDANAALASLLVTDTGQLRGMDLRHFLHPEERAVAWSPDIARAEGRGTPRELRFVTGEGRTIWVSMTISVVHGGDSDDEAFALAVLEDITDRYATQQTLTYQARHDALTGLPNRYALVERLEVALQRLWGSGDHLAVLFCDLDGFKTLNDTLSHRAGDEVLCGVAERLRGAVRPQDTVARLGGDEFVVIAEDVASPQEAIGLGHRLCDSMRAPFRVQGRDVGLSLSVGVTTTIDPRANSEDLLRQADLAMYRAKDGGRNRVEAYVDALEAEAMARMEVQEYLRAAISEGGVHMEYQPVVDMDGAVRAVEALVRIPAPVPLGAGDFVEAAQRNGLMSTLGDEVLRLVVADVSTWDAQGLSLTVQLNVSPAQLSDPGFPPRVAEQVAAAGLTRDRVCFEVGDSGGLWHSEEMIEALQRLHDLGFGVGIDGFGAGYTGLSSLKRVAADYVKVDRALVVPLAGGREEQVIVQAIVQVAHDLGRSVVATGVETPEQVEVLRGFGCDALQGYLYSEPVRAGRVPEVVAAVR